MGIHVASAFKLHAEKCDFSERFVRRSCMRGLTVVWIFMRIMKRNLGSLFVPMHGKIKNLLPQVFCSAHRSLQWRDIWILLLHEKSKTISLLLCVHISPASIWCFLKFFELVELQYLSALSLLELLLARLICIVGRHHPLTFQSWVIVTVV